MEQRDVRQLDYAASSPASRGRLVLGTFAPYLNIIACIGAVCGLFAARYVDAQMGRIFASHPGMDSDSLHFQLVPSAIQAGWLLRWSFVPVILSIVSVVFNCGRRVSGIPGIILSALFFAYSASIFLTAID